MIPTDRAAFSRQKGLLSAGINKSGKKKIIKAVVLSALVYGSEVKGNGYSRNKSI